MKKVALSFSGGKDSCLALYHLMKEGLEVVTLFTTVWKESQETMAHGEKLHRIEKQAEQLGIPVTFIETTFTSYKKDFVKKLKALKADLHIDTVAFGDIYLEGHREWGVNVAAEAGLTAYYPLWTERENVVAMLENFVDLGFKAEIIKVAEEKVSPQWVSHLLDDSFIQYVLQIENICPMGESGEYHTFVYDGPIFHQPVI